MAENRPRTNAAIREEIANEREALGEAVLDLRSELVGMKAIRENLPLLVAGAFVLGFVISGGIGAAIRLLLRQGYERRTARLQLGRIRITARIP